MRARRALKPDEAVQENLVDEASAAVAYDFSRLEQAVELLVRQHEELQAENEKLASELEDREARLRSLDEQILVANEKRQDAVKRIDALIEQLERVDAAFDAEPDAAGSGEED